MKVMKKAVFWLLLCLLVFKFVLPVKAETQTIQLEKRYDLPSAAELEENKANCRGNICADNMMNFQLNALAGAGACTLGGVICGAKSPEEVVSYIQNSVIGQTSTAMAYLYSQPAATTSEYMAWMGERIGIVPKSFAQGVTYSRLLPILPIWKAFRDIAFMLLAIIMLLIGLMIMFRAKVNPQTVANVENTIPRVVVSIVLIWLSFPIAALVIDFMYVIIAAGITVIGAAVGHKEVGLAIQDFTTGGFGTLFSRTLAPVSEFGSIGGTGALTSETGLKASIPILAVAGAHWAAPLAIISSLVGGIITGVSTGDAGAAVLSALSPIFVFLILIVLLFQIFKIFFMLLSAYIQIIIAIILGPIYLLANAIPGRNSFMNWLKGIIANMLSFVVTSIMLYLSWAISSLISARSFWTPPFIMSGIGASQAVVGLITLGIVLLIPQTVQMVKQALGVKSQFQVGPGMLMAPITGSLGQGLGLAGQFHTASLAMPQISKLLGIKSTPKT